MFLNFLKLDVYHPDVAREKLGIPQEIAAKVAQLRSELPSLIKTEAKKLVLPKGKDGSDGDPGKKGDPGQIGPAGAPIVEIVAADSIPAFEAITVLGQRADSNNTAHFTRVVGITVAAVSAGFVAQVEYSGTLTNPAWTWTPGPLVFLNGTSLSQTPPVSGFVMPIGIAKNATTIIVEQAQAILL